MDSHARDARLDQLLKQYQKTKDTKIIIFVLYKKEAVRVESMLARKGWTGIQGIATRPRPTRHTHISAS